MNALSASQPSEYGDRLREILACAAAGILSTEGPEAATEALYRVGDALVGMKP